jgi:hypothetical protein
MSPRHIGRRGALCVTILAVVKTVLGFCRHTKRSAKAVTLYIGAAAKWARIKFGVTHDSVLIRERRILTACGEAMPVHQDIAHRHYDLFNECQPDERFGGRRVRRALRPM